MLRACGNPDQETPIRTFHHFPLILIFVQKITHHNSILQRLLTTTLITAGPLAQVVDCSPSMQEVRGLILVMS
jgi:hypothetical protein